MATALAKFAATLSHQIVLLTMAAVVKERDVSCHSCSSLERKGEKVATSHTCDVVHDTLAHDSPRPTVAAASSMNAQGAANVHTTGNTSKVSSDTASCGFGPHCWAVQSPTSSGQW